MFDAHWVILLKNAEVITGHSNSIKKAAQDIIKNIEKYLDLKDIANIFLCRGEFGYSLAEIKEIAEN